MLLVTQRSTECTSVAGHSSQHNITQHGMLPQHPAGTAKLMWLFIMTLARTIWLPDDGLRTETCRSVFNVLMCKFYKFYKCTVVGVIIDWLNNMHGVTTKIERIEFITFLSSKLVAIWKTAAPCCCLYLWFWPGGTLEGPQSKPGVVQKCGTSCCYRQQNSDSVGLSSSCLVILVDWSIPSC